MAYVSSPDAILSTLKRNKAHHYIIWGRNYKVTYCARWFDCNPNDRQVWNNLASVNRVPDPSECIGETYHMAGITARQIEETLNGKRSRPCLAMMSA